MNFNFAKGDRVHHIYRGTGTFIEYDITSEASVVHFDEDSDAPNEILRITTRLLRKIEE